MVTVLHYCFGRYSYSILFYIYISISYLVAVLGNKCDLEKDREVSTMEGKEFADSIGAPFFETSAKARINVEEGFYQLVREIRKWNSQVQEEPTTKKKKKGSYIGRHVKGLGSKLKSSQDCVIL